MRNYCKCNPLEPEWEGHVTLEFSNTTPLPAKIYANEGAAQFYFLKEMRLAACLILTERENICFRKTLLYQNSKMDKIQISGQKKN